MGTVGIVRCLALCAGRDDFRIARLVMLGQTVGGGFSRGCLQVVQVAVHLLVIRQPLPHVVQHITGEFLALPVGHVLPDPLCVQSGLIHAQKADGGKVVLKCSQIPFGVWVQALVQKLGDDFPLGL